MIYFRNEFFLHFQLDYFLKFILVDFQLSIHNIFLIDQLNSFPCCQSAVDLLLQEKKKRGRQRENNREN